jgi:hypothetical protein
VSHRVPRLRLAFSEEAAGASFNLMHALTADPQGAADPLQGPALFAQAQHGPIGRTFQAPGGRLLYKPDLELPRCALTG